MYQLQLVAQVRAEEQDSLAVDSMETVALSRPMKFTYVNTLLSSEENSYDMYCWGT